MYNIIQTTSLPTFIRIIVSSNIETNPGPGLSKPKCQICNKTVRCSQNASNKMHEWTCLNCIHTALPFYNCRNLDFDSNVAYKTTILHTINCHIETLKNYQKYTSITHINCQSILWTFDEFAVMLNNQHQLDYVNIAGYKLTFKHHKDQKGSSIRFCRKDNISFIKQVMTWQRMLWTRKSRSSNSMVEIKTHHT